MNIPPSFSAISAALAHGAHELNNRLPNIMNITSAFNALSAFALANGPAYMPPLGSDAPPDVWGANKRRNNQRKRRKQWRRLQQFPKR